MERMGRGRWEGGKAAERGAIPSRSRWDTGAAGSVTVGRREEKQQQDAEKGLPCPRQGQTPPSSPENTAGGELTEPQRVQRTTRQGRCVCGLSDEATKPVARTWAKITGQGTGPHSQASWDHRFSLEPALVSSLID